MRAEEIRRNLCELYECRKLTGEEYRSLPAFKLLERMPGLVERLEKYNLPEINKLIIHSKRLQREHWAVKYRAAARFYTLNERQALKEFLRGTKAPNLINEVVRRADMELLKKAYIVLLKRISRLRIRRMSILKKGGELGVVEARSLQLEQVSAAVGHAMNRFENAAESDNSQRAYFEETFNPLEFWEDLERTRIVPPEAMPYFKDEKFCHDILTALDVFQGNRIGVLYFLSRLGYINFRKSPFIDFVWARPRLLAQYLSERLNEDRGCFIGAPLWPLVKLAIEGTLQGKRETRLIFGSLWSELNGEEWEWLWLKLSELQGSLPKGSTAEIFDVFLAVSTGEGRQAAEKFRASFDAPEYEAILKLLPATQASVRRELLQILIKSYRRTAQERRTAQRKILGEPRRVFTALYQEVEKLERIAVKQGGKELKQCVSDLREGLADLGVDSLEADEPWMSRASLSYNPARHEMLGTDKSEKVILQTRGFLYQDEEGETKRYLAKVEAVHKQGRKLEQKSINGKSAAGAEQVSRDDKRKNSKVASKGGK